MTGRYVTRPRYGVLARPLRQDVKLTKQKRRRSRNFRSLFPTSTSTSVPPFPLAIPVPVPVPGPSFTLYLGLYLTTLFSNHLVAPSLLGCPFRLSCLALPCLDLLDLPTAHDSFAYAPSLHLV